MGRAKAAIIAPRSDGLSLSARTAGLLVAATDAALEVGPGFTSLDRVIESGPGRGPLAAVVDGWAELGRRGWSGPVLVVATDLPHLTAGMLAWLTEYEPGHSVVPIAGGRLQTLCARYQPSDLEAAAGLVESGRRKMLDLVESIGARCVPEDVWVARAGRPDCLVDVDTPEDLDAAGGCNP